MKATKVAAALSEMSPAMLAFLTGVATGRAEKYTYKTYLEIWGEVLEHCDLEQLEANIAPLARKGVTP